MTNKYHYIRRYKQTTQGLVDIGVIDVPGELVAEQLKSHPAWVDLGEISFEKIAELPVIEQTEEFQCPLCEFIGKNEKSLRLHKIKRHA